MKKPVTVDDDKLQSVTYLLLKLVSEIAIKEVLDHRSPEFEDVLADKYPTVAALILAYGAVLGDIL